VPGSTIRTLVHGDPWYENLTVDERGLTGILDWEFLSWSDPANDLGVTFEMGEAFFREVLASYQAVSLREDATLERRARELFATRVLYGIKFAIDRDDEAEWRDSLAKLRAGPILAG
jgi:aminoglycoside phosphotransferase (APT) family kinase protein